MAKPYGDWQLDEEGLLSSKSELWQSSAPPAVIVRGVCYHRNLNYGKAIAARSAACGTVCYHRNLNYGKAFTLRPLASSTVCYHRNLNYGKAVLPFVGSKLGFAIIEI